MVVLAVLVWLIIVPIVELVALGYRALVRSMLARRLRRPDELLAVGAQPHERPPARD